MLCCAVSVRVCGGECPSQTQTNDIEQHQTTTLIICFNVRRFALLVYCETPMKLFTDVLSPRDVPVCVTQLSCVCACGMYVLVCTMYINSHFSSAVWNSIIAHPALILPCMVIL